MSYPERSTLPLKRQTIELAPSGSPSPRASPLLLPVARQVSCATDPGTSSPPRRLDTSCGVARDETAGNSALQLYFHSVIREIFPPAPPPLPTHGGTLTPALVEEQLRLVFPSRARNAGNNASLIGGVGSCSSEASPTAPVPVVVDCRDVVPPYRVSTPVIATRSGDRGHEHSSWHAAPMLPASPFGHPSKNHPSEQDVYPPGGLDSLLTRIRTGTLFADEEAAVAEKVFAKERGAHAAVAFEAFGLGRVRPAQQAKPPQPHVSMRLHRTGSQRLRSSRGRNDDDENDGKGNDNDDDEDDRATEAGISFGASTTRSIALSAASSGGWVSTAGRSLGSSIGKSTTKNVLPSSQINGGASPSPTLPSPKGGPRQLPPLDDRQGHRDGQRSPLSIAGSPHAVAETPVVLGVGRTGSVCRLSGTPIISPTACGKTSPALGCRANKLYSTKERNHAAVKARLHVAPTAGVPHLNSGSFLGEPGMHGRR